MRWSRCRGGWSAHRARAPQGARASTGRAPPASSIRPRARETDDPRRCRRSPDPTGCDEPPTRARSPRVVRIETAAHRRSPTPGRVPIPPPRRWCRAARRVRLRGHECGRLPTTPHQARTRRFPPAPPGGGSRPATPWFGEPRPRRHPGGLRRSRAAWSFQHRYRPPRRCDAPAAAET